MYTCLSADAFLRSCPSRLEYADYREGGIADLDWLSDRVRIRIKRFGNIGADHRHIGPMDVLCFRKKRPLAGTELKTSSVSGTVCEKSTPATSLFVYLATTGGRGPKSVTRGIMLTETSFTAGHSSLIASPSSNVSGFPNALQRLSVPLMPGSKRKI